MFLVIKNVFFLYVLHIVRLVIPVILLPYLTRILSDDNFGLYLYFLSVSTWLFVLLEYGFGVSATREIAKAKSKGQIRKIVQRIQNAKLWLVILSLLIYIPAVISIDIMRQHFEWALIAWLIGISNALVPTYYFQGTENLRFISLFEGGFGFINLVLIMLCVSSDADAILLMLIIAFLRFTVLVLVTAYVYRQLSIQFVYFSLRSALRVLSKYKQMFFFQSASGSYTSMNVVILGMYVTPALVGFYSTADRLIKIGLGFIGQAQQALFPRITALSSSDDARTTKKYQLAALFIFTAIGVLGTAFIQLLGGWIIRLMFGDDFALTIQVIEIMSYLVPAISISSVLGFQYLIVNDGEKIFNYIIFAAALLNLLLIFSLTPLYGVIAMAWIWVGIEWFITVMLSVVVVTMIVRRREPVKPALKV